MNQSLTHPFLSILIRSYNRLPSVLEIIDVCLAQDYDHYEIVVMDQSDEAHWEQTKAVFARHAGRVRVIRARPLGSAMAKNLGVHYCKGDIVLFMDDDDLPLGTGWISAHARCYVDPLCIGVSGRIVKKLDEPNQYRNRKRAYQRCLTYSFYKRGRDFTGIDQVKKPVEWLHGMNSSIRRSYILEIGGWYPHVTYFDEHSFNFKLRKALKPGEYLFFDPTPQAKRRYNISGGLDKRNSSFNSFLKSQMKYYHWVVAHHFPFRFFLLYPFVLLDSFIYSARWLRKHSRYSDKIWMPLLGTQAGQYVIIITGFIILPLLALRYLISPRPQWDGNVENIGEEIDLNALQV